MNDLEPVDNDGQEVHDYVFGASGNRPRMLRGERRVEALSGGTKRAAETFPIQGVRLDVLGLNNSQKTQRKGVPSMAQKVVTQADLDALVDARIAERMKMAKADFDALVDRQVKRRIAERTPGPGGSKLFNPEYHGDDDPAHKAAAFMEAFETDEVEKGPSGFKGMREFLRCVALAPGDERLVPASKALSEQDPEAGGYLVPNEYLGRLLLGAVEQSRFMGLVQTIPMKSLTIEAPVAASMDESSGAVYGGVSFTWTDELAEKAIKDFKLLKVKLLAKVAAAIARSSNQLLEDSSPRAEDVINQIFTSAFGWTVDNVILNGLGAGSPLGIIGAPGTYVLAKEGSQVAKTINWTNVRKMYSRLWPVSKDSAALRWVINDEAVEQVLSLSLPVGTGGSAVFMGDGSAVRPMPKTLLGIPIIWSQFASALGAKGDIGLYDFDKYILGIRKALSVAVSQHLYFLTNETAFRFEARLDGQPILPAVIKSRTSWETSPFVVLAERA